MLGQSKTDLQQGVIAHGPEAQNHKKMRERPRSKHSLRIVYVIPLCKISINAAHLFTYPALVFAGGGLAELLAQSVISAFVVCPKF